jgi:mannose-6-phosphate isomerase-like protein (cupin superfamily)
VHGELITDRPERRVSILAARPGLTATLSDYAAGQEGPGLHVHREHTDAFCVLAGELTFTVGPAHDEVRLGPGGFVAVPAGVVHTFANRGTAPARWLNLHAPDAGFAAYMRGARDGVRVAWDSFDAPADGGAPVSGVTVAHPAGGDAVELPGLAVAVAPAAGGRAHRAVGRRPGDRGAGSVVPRDPSSRDSRCRSPPPSGP